MLTVTIADEPADSDDVRWCFARYYEELARRFEAGFDIAAALPLEEADLTPPRGLVLVARMDGQPVGCGAVKLAEPDIAEIKRMWVATAARGQGVGRRLLAELEARAVAAGKSIARLETNRSLVEAIALYQGRGYREVAPFNDEVHADHWFEKDLSPSRGSQPDG
jgi:ribosomal protein S18 acetylase RimI-like enzyme